MEDKLLDLSGPHILGEAILHFCLVLNTLN